MITLSTILLIAAFIVFVIAFIGIAAGRYSLLAGGLALATLAWIVANVNVNMAQ